MLILCDLGSRALCIRQQSMSPISMEVNQEDASTYESELPLIEICNFPCYPRVWFLTCNENGVRTVNIVRRQKNQVSF